LPSFLSPLLRDSTRPWRLQNTRTGAFVATTLLTAFDSASRKTGLLQHAALPERTALIIAPTNAVHTFFMKFPIDVVFVAKDGKVVKVRTNVRPWRMTAAFGAYAVIELRADSLRHVIVTADDRLRLVDSDVTNF
jgi:uncharacterized membrane protein (UPF0127 family)